MHIDQLTLKNFRNFESVDIPLNSKMNIVVGNNGSGKSSLLMGALTAASAFFLGIDYASPRSIKSVRLHGQKSTGGSCLPMSATRSGNTMKMSLRPIK